MRIQRPSRSVRSGTVAVELAVVLPLLMFLAVIGVDFARVFSRAMVLQAAARNACVYASQDSDTAANTAAIKAVALKDLTDVAPTPTVVSSVFTGTDGLPYVKVTVSMTFKTVTNFPGVPSNSQLIRSTTMRVCTKTPKPGTY
jgi:Flp pilus assembly protein TadG